MLALKSHYLEKSGPTAISASDSSTGDGGHSNACHGAKGAAAIK